MKNRSRYELHGKAVCDNQKGTCKYFKSEKEAKRYFEEKIGKKG